MTAIEILVPAEPSLAVDDLAEKLGALRHVERFAPFDAALMKFTGAFSQRLLNDSAARNFPELQALGFWLRPAALEGMKKDFVPKPGTIAVPQGLAFHIPPANVDTMFAYSLFVSLLCGNANVIRLSSRRGAVMTLLVRLIGESLVSAPEKLRSSLIILGYEHDRLITETISGACDLRVIWGSDATVHEIRAIPPASFGRELIFPDRFSWSAMNVNAYRVLDQGSRQKLAERYFNDLFWFDQQGCASPRIILWRGKTDRELTDDFYRRVAHVADAKKWRLDVDSNLAKQTRNYGTMIDAPITEKRDFGSVLTVFSLADLSGLETIRKTPCFGGTLLELFVGELSDIVPFVERRDQTLTQFGFTQDELEVFVKKINGSGFDRFVPMGEALTFECVWDEYDLPVHFTRLVTVRT